MKKYKLLIGILVVIILFSRMFFSSVSRGQAQSENDWSDPVNLSFSGSTNTPTLVVDYQGVAHAVWVDEVDGYKYSQSADGITWTSPQTAQFPFDPKGSPPVLVADANGSIHVFWISSDGELFYGQATPLDFPDPGNWTTTSRLGRDILSYDVILDARGALHLAYIRNNTTNVNPAGVYYKQSIIGGGFWSEPATLYVSDYFRDTNESDSYVRISTSRSQDNERIYVTWDNRAQKRVFMAVSEDTGLTWNATQQIKGPEDTGGIDVPFTLTVSAFHDNVLLIWQVGEPGSDKCTVFSQWSNDGGENWGDVVAVLGGRSECPVSTKVIDRTEEYMSVMLIGQIDPVLIAWNGERWSDIQTQAQLPTFSNPVTFDAIILGCRIDLIIQNRLFVVGCDQGRGGDIWFLSRSLEPLDNWFSPLPVWGEPVVLSVKSETPERISQFSPSSDTAGNIHATWVQSPTGNENASNATIEYASWNGKQWTNPESVITFMNGVPIHLLATADSLDRLLITFIDGYKGDLAFSWADLEKANLTSEWADVTNLPSPSQLVNSSDLVVDGSGRIITAYAVPVNEERGIYLAQSSDAGNSWSSPVRVFDAVSEGWELIDKPRISLGADGVLHLVFVRGTLREGQPVGLYYSHSLDGGVTWSNAKILSEGEIEWADIASYGDKTVHVVWQENDGLVFANLSLISQDGGVTWGKQNNVTGVNENGTQVSLASNGRGLLHFVQLANKSNNETYNQIGLVLQDWKWDGGKWNLDLTKDITLKGEEINYSLSAGITSTGFLGVFIPVEYTNSIAETPSEILTFSRYLDDAGNGPQVPVPSIPTPTIESGGSNPSLSQPTATPDFSVLYDDNVSTSPIGRNITGLVLIVFGVIVTIILLLWRRPAKK